LNDKFVNINFQTGNGGKSLRFQVFALLIGSDVRGENSETSPDVFNILLVALVTADNRVVLVVVTDGLAKIRTLCVDLV